MNCSSCNKPYRIINQKYKLCQLCNHRRLHPEGKKQTVLKRTPIKYKRKKTGERELFIKEIWNKRIHQCTGCGSYLTEPKAIYFSHTIRKGRRNDLRLHPDNIELECDSCHHIWDNGTIEQKKKLLSFEHKLKFIFEHEKSLYYKLNEQFGK